MRLLTETKKVNIKDSEFTIGIIDRRKFNPIKMCFLSAAKFLTRLTQEEIKALTPAQLGQKAVEGLTPEQIQKNEASAFSAQWDLVKYGVKAHSLKDAEDKDVALVKDDGGCVADQTIDLYELNGFLPTLANEIFVFNTLTENEKKN